MMSSGKRLHVSLWIAQGLLAIAFGLAGLSKLVLPYARLAADQPWARHVPEWVIAPIGVVEIVGALGMLLPAATRIKPILTPLAASGFVVVMLLAATLRVSIGETTAPNVVLGGLATFVAWGRFRSASVAAR